MLPWYGTPCTISSINHMVTVVGYGTGYYLVANSWGTTFGSNGYIVVDSGYFENYFSDVMYPLEGTYEPATNYAKMSISHARRSDIRSLQFSVNGTTVWSNSPLPKNLPKGTGSFDTDSRANWQLAVDLSSATWGGANTVTSKCTDNVSGTTGSITNFTLRYAGTDYVSTNTPVSIPDNSTGGAIAVVATATATSAPSFGANPGPVTATTGVARAFTVSAGGYPVPVLALQSTTASSGHSFVPATGVLTYTPPIADIGARSFTFTASNSAGVATQTVSVTVVEAPPAAPASIWASATNTADFTAAWSSVAEATGYRLDVATNSSFSSGGGANLMTNPGFETGDSTGWDKFETEYAVASTDPQEGTYHVAITATATRDLTQNVAITGDGSTEYEISYWYKGSGNARIWASWTTGGQVSGDSLQPVDYNPAAAEWTKMTYTVVPQSGANTLFYEIRTYSGASMQFDSFYVGWRAAAAGIPATCRAIRTGRWRARARA
jgi:hypothetical protein